MKTSVLINNYNYGRYLQQCVRSALDQDYPDIQIVVVDDGSTDDSYDVLSTFGSVITVLRQPNGGQLSAIAAGASQCLGEYIFLLDSDDFWPPDYVSKVMEVVRRANHPDLLFSGVIDVDAGGSLIRRSQHYPVDIDYGYSYIISHYTPNWLGQVTSAIAIKRTALLALILKSAALSARYRINADDVIVVGADLLGFRKIFLTDSSIFYRVHGANAWTNAKWTKQKKYEYLILKCLLFSMLSTLSGANPWLSLGMPFAEEFESKDKVPFAEAVRYTKATLLFAKSRKFRQVWRILCHWRRVGTSRHRMLSRLLIR